MSTYESVVKKLSRLAPADLQVIDLLADRLLQHSASDGENQAMRRAAAHYAPLTEEQWIAKLDTARRHIEEGKGVDGDAVFERLSRKYNIS